MKALKPSSQSLEQFTMDSVKAAVAEDDDDVARFRFRFQTGDDGICAGLMEAGMT